MNAKTIQKHYDKLTPRERLALIVNACGRGDTAEADRLNDSAPRKTWNIAHHFGAGHAYHALAGYYIAQQLEAIANSFLLLLFVDTPIKGVDLDDVALIVAWRIDQQAKAWKQFSDRLGIDPQAAQTMLGVKDGGTLDFAEQVARKMAPQLEDVRAAFKRSPFAGVQDAEPRTADSIAKQWLEMFDDDTRKWGA